MMFRLRREDCMRDPFDHGVLVEPDGTARRLGAERFELTPLRQWQGPERPRLQPVPACRARSDNVPESSPGNGPWPVHWQLQLGNERFQIRAALLDQRMLTSVRYWEGLVEVYDGSGKSRVGRGYMELTGYAGKGLGSLFDSGPTQQ